MIYVINTVNNEPFDCLIVDGVEIRLQSFPHIGHKIALLWGTQECINYIYQLLHDQDRGYRSSLSKGFPGYVIDELLRLLSVHPAVLELKIPPTYQHYRWDPTDHASL